MTAGERLRQLSGLAGVSAGVMLLTIGAGATAGAALVDYSKLSTGTAAEHLLVDAVIAPTYRGSVSRTYTPKKKRKTENEEALFMCDLI